MKYVIQCARCRAPRQSDRPNVKYCHLCALLAELEFMEGRQARLFAPVGRQDLDCGECARSRWLGTCMFCGKDGRDMLQPDVSVCGRCARASARRTRLIDYLRGRSDAQKQLYANDPDLPVYVPDLNAPVFLPAPAI